MFKRHSYLACLALALATSPAHVSAQATEAQEVDSLRLASAKVTVGHILPPGTFARVMQQSMDTMMGPMMDSVDSMSLRDIAAMTGRPEAELQQMGEGSLKDMMAILDPHYEERMRLTMEVMTGEMTKMMETFEPAFQDGLARAYAKRFSTRQLGELNAFFSTPTGAIYAAESMVIMTDPEVAKKMQELIPEMMKHMPAMMSALESATAHLPKPRKEKDLTPAERRKLEQLFGKAN